jgi:hypothetical protein
MLASMLARKYSCNTFVTKEEFFSFLIELSGDEELQQTLRETTSVQALVQVGLSRGYRFSETDLINHFAETLIRPNDDLASFLKGTSKNMRFPVLLRI